MTKYINYTTNTTLYKAVMSAQLNPPKQRHQTAASKLFLNDSNPLQLAATHAARWCDVNWETRNTGKSLTITFTFWNSINHEQIMIKNASIKEILLKKLLDVQLHKDLHFFDHVDCIISKARLATQSIF